MEEYINTLCNVNSASDKRCGLKIVGKPCEGKPHARFDEGLSASDKRCGLKIVGKPCEGKPHARFDEGLLGRSMAAPAAYSTKFNPNIFSITKTESPSIRSFLFVVRIVVNHPEYTPF
jgi:hypothetical protein